MGDYVPAILYSTKKLSTKFFEEADMHAVNKESSYVWSDDYGTSGYVNDHLHDFFKTNNAPYVMLWAAGPESNFMVTIFDGEESQTFSADGFEANIMIALTRSDDVEYIKELKAWQKKIKEIIKWASSRP